MYILLIVYIINYVYILLITTPSLELSLDYPPVIITVNSKVMIENKFCTLCQNKIIIFPRLKTTLDNYISVKTDNDISCTVENFNYAI